MHEETTETTDLLLAWRSGDPAAAEEVIARLYRDLHGLAAHFMAGERWDHTLQPTALVNEAYLRLRRQHCGWLSRAHFLAVAAKTMRRVLLDHARRRTSGKRGGGAIHLSLQQAGALPEDRPVDLVRLDDALTVLAARDAQKAEVIELRFFGGLSIAETAEVLACSPATVVRQWRAARAWLFHALADRGGADAH